MSLQPDPRFVALFDQPSIAGMYALSPKDFERFVGYVLRRAGYDVKEVGFQFLRGADLEMRLPGKKRIYGAVECKRFAADKLVKASVVKGVKGAAADNPGARPLVITTSDFNTAAHKLAESGAKKAHLLNGQQLIRYIRYVRGSLHDDETALTSLSPEFFGGRNAPLQSTGREARIVTIANNKGGVGKTTTAFYLGAELAKQGNRVLLIDLDAQANLTDYCFPEQAEGQDADAERFPNITQYFSGQKQLPALVTATGIDGLCIIPSDPFLRLRDLGGSGRPDMELQFARDVRDLATQPLADLGGVPDCIVIDTPPAMSVFTRAGLAAADYVLAPVRPRVRTLPGTRNMLKTLRTMNALTGDTARFLGFVITHWDDLKVSEFFRDVRLPREVRDYGGLTFTTIIPLDNQLETLRPGANTKGAKAYATLGEEVAGHVNIGRNTTGTSKSTGAATNVRSEAQDTGDGATFEISRRD